VGSAVRPAVVVPVCADATAPPGTMAVPKPAAMTSAAIQPGGVAKFHGKISRFAGRSVIAAKTPCPAFNLLDEGVQHAHLLASYTHIMQITLDTSRREMPSTLLANPNERVLAVAKLSQVVDSPPGRTHVIGLAWLMSVVAVMHLEERAHWQFAPHSYPTRG
jgi:hypothetical protein